MKGFVTRNAWNSRTQAGGWAPRVGMFAVVGLLLAGAMGPPAAATDLYIEGTVVDDDGNPMANEQVTITNTANSQWTTATTDGNGDFSVAASTVGASSGTVVAVSGTGTRALANCQVLVNFNVMFPVMVGVQPVMVGIVNFAGAVGTTLTPGKTEGDRDANQVITLKAGMGGKRVQGNGAPWGNFDVHQDFSFGDNWDKPGVLQARSYQFKLTIAYLGYYDANCAYVAVGGVGNSNANSGVTGYTDGGGPGGIPVSSGVVTQQANGLNAAAVGQGANDKLMRIEVTAGIDHCDGVAPCVAGQLQISTTRTYYVEP